MMSAIDDMYFQALNNKFKTMELLQKAEMEAYAHEFEVKNRPKHVNAFEKKKQKTKKEELIEHYNYINNTKDKLQEFKQ